MNQQTNSDNGASQTPCTCGPNMQLQGCHSENCPHYRMMGQPGSPFHDQYRGQGNSHGQGSHSKDWEDGYAAGYSAALASMQSQGPLQRGQWQGQLGVAQVNGQNCQSWI